MLILTRRSGESLMIGEDIIVTLLAIRGQHARIGIEAPKAIPIHRMEIHCRLKAQDERAESPPEVSDP